MTRKSYDFFETIINALKLKVYVFGHAALKPDNWHYPNVTAPFNRLYFVFQGKGLIHNRQQRVELEKNTAYLIPMNRTYSYECTEPMRKWYLHFNLELFPGNDVFKNTDVIASRHLRNANAIEDLIKKADGESLETIIAAKASILELLCGFVKIDRQELEKSFKLAQKYEEIFRYLENNISLQTTVASLADLAGKSVSNFSTLFRKDFGISPHLYLKQELARKAKVMLLMSDRVKETAFDLGFDNEFYFSRFFRKQTGFSPTEYKKRTLFEQTEPDAADR